MYNLEWAERPNDFALDESMMGLGDEANVLQVQPMEPWRVVVGMGLAAVVIWGALSIADRSHA
jgi:hypothetical protein